MGIRSAALLLGGAFAALFATLVGSVALASGSDFRPLAALLIATVVAYYFGGRFVLSHGQEFRTRAAKYQLAMRGNNFHGDASTPRAIVSLPTCGLVEFNSAYERIFRHPELTSSTRDFVEAILSFDSSAQIRCLCSLVRKVQAIVENRHCSLERAFSNWSPPDSPPFEELAPEIDYLQIDADETGAFYRAVRIGIHPLIPIKHPRARYLVEVLFHAQLQGVVRVLQLDKQDRLVTAEVTFIGDDGSDVIGPQKVQVSDRNPDADQLFSFQEALSEGVAMLNGGVPEEEVRRWLLGLRDSYRSYSRGEIILDILNDGNSLLGSLNTHIARLVDGYILELVTPQLELALRHGTVREIDVMTQEDARLRLGT